MNARTLANCPEPKGLFASADVKVNAKKDIILREDVGAYDETGQIVPVDQLPEIFTPGTAIIADVNLRL